MYESSVATLTTRIRIKHVYEGATSNLSDFKKPYSMSPILTGEARIRTQAKTPIS